MKNKYEGKPLNTFIKKEKGLIVGFEKSYENKFKDLEKLNPKDKKAMAEFNDYQNKIGKYEVAKKPVYDTNKMWDILEAEIPALKKYRKSVREDK